VCGSCVRREMAINGVIRRPSAVGGVYIGGSPPLNADEEGLLLWSNSSSSPWTWDGEDYRCPTGQQTGEDP